MFVKIMNGVQPDYVLYQAAIQDSMYQIEDKIYENLVVINRENRDLIWRRVKGEDYLLVLSWKDNIGFYDLYSTIR